MTDFIEGAAYVSPSRNQVYIYRESSECLHRGGTSGGESYWIYEEEFDPIPDDLVMIWAPGDTVITATEPPLNRTIIHDHRDPETFVAWMDKNRAFYSAFNERPLKRRTASPETVLKIFTNAPDPDFLWTPEKDAAHKRTQRLETRGWFYPTKYNEEPGRYEDEEGDRWTFRTTDKYPDGGWYYPLHNEWYQTPTVEGGPIAVRWVGELDA